MLLLGFLALGWGAGTVPAIDNDETTIKQPTNASAAAWRRFIDIELSEGCKVDKLESAVGSVLIRG